MGSGLQQVISIHALREESDLPIPEHTDQPYEVISIHALREESDDANETAVTHDGISIHALREESDICGWEYPVATG